MKDHEAGRTFSGLHDTLLPMSSKTQSLFQQLRASKAWARPSVKKGVKAAKAASAQLQELYQALFLVLSLLLICAICGCCFHSSYLIFWMTKCKITMRNMEALSLPIQSMH
jgi:hypothetical protein